MHTDILSPETVKKHMASSYASLTVARCLPSTNLALKEEALRGAPEGRVLIAEKQTAGRGRLGRSFFSPKGNIYLSVLFYPTLPLSVYAGRLTTLASLAVARAIESVCGLMPRIKWVNDLLLDGKKVCGILAEAVETKRGHAVILGIGINVAKTEFPKELRDIATAIGNHSAPPSRAPLIAAVLDELSALDLSRPERFMEEYKSRSAVLGNDILVLPYGKPSYTARAVDITADGALVVEKDGHILEISSGEVSIRPLDKEFL